MRNTWKAATAGAVVAVVSAAGFATFAQARPPVTPSPVPSAVATASTTLARDISYMREEERLARDVYKALADHYDGARPFSNITNSEQRHFDIMGTLLVRFGLPDPSAGLPAGDYAFDELDTMYAELVASGKQSLTNAYKAGVTVETTDIADLERVIAETSAADAKSSFETLLAGSRMHLQAFSKTPASGQQGQGNGTGQGNGQGTGQGNGMGRGNGQGMGQQNRAQSTPSDCPHR